MSISKHVSNLSSIAVSIYSRQVLTLPIGEVVGADVRFSCTGEELNVRGLSQLDSARNIK